MGTHTGTVIHLYFSKAGDANWLLLLITGRQICFVNLALKMMAAG